VVKSNGVELVLSPSKALDVVANFPINLIRKSVGNLMTGPGPEEKLVIKATVELDCQDYPFEDNILFPTVNNEMNIGETAVVTVHKKRKGGWSYQQEYTGTLTAKSSGSCSSASPCSKC